MTGSYRGCSQPSVLMLRIRSTQAAQMRVTLCLAGDSHLLLSPIPALFLCLCGHRLYSSLCGNTCPGWAGTSPDVVL